VSKTARKGRDFSLVTGHNNLKAGPTSFKMPKPVFLIKNILLFFPLAPINSSPKIWKGGGGRKGRKEGRKEKGRSGKRDKEEGSA